MTLATIVIALQLVPLHQVDGRAVFVNPSEIAAVATPRRGEEKLSSPGAACLVFTADGKYWQVLETCAVVKQLIEKLP